MIADETLRLYEELVATLPGVERKGRTMPYTAINGHMFSFLAPDGTLALRLSDADRAAFLDTYATTLVEQHGRVLREYVAVPAALLGRTDELKPYFDLPPLRQLPAAEEGDWLAPGSQKIAPTQDTSSQMTRITPITTPSRIRPMSPRMLQGSAG
ncbi:MAG TPA: hypothetical protein VEW95_02520 [Candidatus Limnocylindrales bacterium]|nr:hypothetical protein [Candidatus Limnocylindrales bacterium]